VQLEYARVSNLHWYYDRILALAPGPILRSARRGAPIKSAETSLAVRYALGRIARRLGRIDLLEFPEETALPILFRGFPYTVKLHGSDATLRYFCGEELRRDDLRGIRWEAQLLRHARLVSAPSSAVADHVAQVCNYSRSRIAVLPNPLDVEKFSPQPGGSMTTRSSVLYVGRMDLRKGLTTLARAAEAIMSAAPAVTIDIVGGQTEEVTAASLLAHIPPSLHRRVKFHGRVPRDSLPDYYRQAAVCVVPSRWDNSPNTVYEAMGCGTPVVASCVGGIPELVADGRTGLMIPPDDPVALADAIKSLLADPGYRARMGRAARDKAVGRFASAMIAAHALELYRMALDRRDTKCRGR
jgi:glycosyltransferase involved in cell wall biosynthesis